MYVVNPVNVRYHLYCTGKSTNYNLGVTTYYLKMVDDRNLTAHTYDEQFVIALAERIRDYEKFLQMWYAQMLAE